MDHGRPGLMNLQSRTHCAFIVLMLDISTQLVGSWTLEGYLVAGSSAARGRTQAEGVCDSRVFALPYCSSQLCFSKGADPRTVQQKRSAKVSEVLAVRFGRGRLLVAVARCWRGASGPLLSWVPVFPCRFRVHTKTDHHRQVTADVTYLLPIRRDVGSKAGAPTQEPVISGIPLCTSAMCSSTCSQAMTCLSCCRGRSVRVRSLVRHLWFSCPAQPAQYDWEHLDSSGSSPRRSKRSHTISLSSPETAVTFVTVQQKCQVLHVVMNR